MKIKRLFSAILIATLLPAAVAAQNAVTPGDDDTQAESADIFEDDITTNITRPKVGRQHDAVEQFMRYQAETIYRALEKAVGKPIEDKNVLVETERKDEVIVVTIPTDMLFLPTDSVLSSKADPLLKPFVRYAEQPGLYKVVLAVHSDNTGNAIYQERLTEGRVVSLYDWFERHAKNADMVIGYPMGATKPVNPGNETRLKRAANRRLEIYIVPNEGMIKRAKDHKLRP